MTELSQLELTTGAIYIIVVILHLILAISLLAKYFSTKDKRIIYFTLVIAFMAFPYIAISINFISTLVTGSSIEFFLFVLLAFGIPPISAVFWMILITELMYKDKRKIILGLFLIYWIIF